MHGLRKHLSAFSIRLYPAALTSFHSGKMPHGSVLSNRQKNNSRPSACARILLDDEAAFGVSFFLKLADIPIFLALIFEECNTEKGTSVIMRLDSIVIGN